MSKRKSTINAEVPEEVTQQLVSESATFFVSLIEEPYNYGCLQITKQPTTQLLMQQHNQQGQQPTTDSFCYEVRINNSHDGSFYTYNSITKQKFNFMGNPPDNNNDLNSNNTNNNNTNNTLVEGEDWEFNISTELQQTVAKFYSIYEEHGCPWQSVMLTVLCEENTSEMNWRFQCDFVYPDNTKKRCIVRSRQGDAMDT